MSNLINKEIDNAQDYAKKFSDYHIDLNDFKYKLNIIAKTHCSGCTKCAEKPSIDTKSHYCVSDINEKFKLFYPQAFIWSIFSSEHLLCPRAYRYILHWKNNEYEDLTLYESLEKISQIMEKYLSKHF